MFCRYCYNMGLCATHTNTIIHRTCSTTCCTIHTTSCSGFDMRLCATHTNTIYYSAHLIGCGPFARARKKQPRTTQRARKPKNKIARARARAQERERERESVCASEPGAHEQECTSAHARERECVCVRESTGAQEQGCARFGY